MSSRRNNNSGSPIGAIVGVIAAFVLFMMFVNRGGTPKPTRGPVAPSAPNAAPAYQAVVRNPIEEMLAAPAGIQRTDGTALAVLVDVSGSMQQAVADADGKRRPKIEIARRCVVNLVTQAEKFAKEHPDRPVVLGIYEFSSRSNQPSCRNLMALATPSVSAAEAAVARMRPNGGTPIGDAMIAAKRDLDRSAKRRTHILVVTDGENNQGYSPADVANAASRLEEEGRPALYFIAFDIDAAKFSAVRDAGGLVMPAANETELKQTLDYLLTGKILAEQPLTPATK